MGNKGKTLLVNLPIDIKIHARSSTEIEKVWIEVVEVEPINLEAPWNKKEGTWRGTINNLDKEEHTLKIYAKVGNEISEVKQVINVQ